jgi:hypothetical protein
VSESSAESDAAEEIGTEPAHDSVSTDIPKPAIPRTAAMHARQKRVTNISI